MTKNKLIHAYINIKIKIINLVVMLVEFQLLARKITGSKSDFPV